MYEQLRTRDEFKKEILGAISRVSNSHSNGVVFSDACRCMMISIAAAVNISEHERLEKEYKTYVEKYGKKGMLEISNVMTLVCLYLENWREDVLGHVLEILHATEKCFGQFFTPESVSRVMARIAIGNLNPDKDGLVKICDPACGAAVNLIEGAEIAIHENHVPQRNIFIEGDDIDSTVCAIAYIQLSLLGYAAVIRHMDTLSMKEYEAPLYTPGYFFHAFPMRFPHGVFFESENIVDRPIEKSVMLDESTADEPKGSEPVIKDHPDQMYLFGDM